MLDKIKFSGLSKSDLLSLFLSELKTNQNPKLLVTPNLDHLVKLERLASFREVYLAADYVVCDGWPVSVLGKVFDIDTGVRWPGSSLVPELFENLKSLGVSARIYLLGSPPGVNEIAAKIIGENWPNIDVVGHCCPPIGFLNDDIVNLAICEEINCLLPDFIIIGLGAPTQELFFGKNSHFLRKGLFFGVGATTEFIAGARKRAPELIIKLRCEWLYRFFQEPRRLGRRYLECGIYFIRMIALGVSRRFFR